MAQRLDCRKLSTPTTNSLQRRNLQALSKMRSAPLPRRRLVLIGSTLPDCSRRGDIGGGAREAVGIFELAPFLRAGDEFVVCLIEEFAQTE